MHCTRLLLLVSLSGWLLLFSRPTQAQVATQDSLALLELFEATSGTAWNNNTGWLSGPVPIWFGVTVSNGRVVSLALPGNNLQQSVPAGIDALTALQTLDLAGNALQSVADMPSLAGLQSLRLNDNQLEDLPQTQSSILSELNCANNRLTFEDLAPFLTFVINNFTYAPQAPVGEGGFVYVTPAGSVTLDVEVGGTGNEYQWAHDGLPITALSLSSPLDINNASTADEGAYVCTIINPSFPDLTLTSLPQTLLLTAFDIAGGEYIPNHLIMEFVDEATQAEKDSLLNYYQASRLDSCLCGVLELWLLPDTAYLPEGEIIIGTEGIKEDAMTKSEIEETGFNYIVALLEDGPPMTAYRRRTMDAWLPPLDDNQLAVAVIDVGIDLTHAALLPFGWMNTEETADGLDEDDNCLPDDLRGYNFAKRDNLPLDLVNGHGTHVAGIVIDGVLATSDIRLMALKSHDDDGNGNLFNALCGIYYANDQNARVINLSWGYAGLPSPLLESAISRAGEDCGALVVASAGNDGVDNDATPHYPSSFELDNLISVAALNIAMDSLAGFSNYGLQSVDLAAPGERILSTLPGNMTGFKSGTSMAAAAVSNAAIRLMETNPTLTYLNVRSAILNSVAELTSLDGLVETGGKLDLPAALLLIQDAEPDTSCLLVNALASTPVSPFQALRVYPQPFQDAFTVAFVLAEPAAVTLTLYDARGRTMGREHRRFAAGEQRFSWAATDGNLPAGLYVLRLQSGGSQLAVKLLRQ
ncbi:MAG: S8 family serine peptidase [Lewinella sp.]|nr:S8 family serine peptidase [Lewinella sp.]